MMTNSPNPIALRLENRHTGEVLEIRRPLTRPSDTGSGVLITIHEGRLLRFRMTQRVSFEGGG